MGREQRMSIAAPDTPLGATDSGKIIRDLTLIYLIKAEKYQNQVGSISGMQGWFNIIFSSSEFYHTNRV